MSSVRWIGFRHVESEERGALNAWLGVAPCAQAVCGFVGATVSVNDFDRPGLASSAVPGKRYCGTSPALSPTTGPAPPCTDRSLRRLAAPEPRTLALMQGSSICGDGRIAILDRAAVIREIPGRSEGTS